MAGDSIALLQERFRQLQKDKQRRKEKELLRKLSDQRKESFPSDLKLAQLPTAEDSLSLSLNNMKQQQQEEEEQSHRQAMVMLKKWKNFEEHGDSSAQTASNSEVDTTLHL